WGSMIFADGRLYVTSQNGITRVFVPNPEKHELLAENDLEESSNSTPAVSDGEIFLRTFGHVWCVAD
ncbi:MAG: pyrrolo-quinoline quinone, partial [Planctomycetaceae bacterium]|nr:pyrrolo-quinoline quinone [Planctomycetaceae bacterium]